MSCVPMFEVIFDIWNMTYRPPRDAYDGSFCRYWLPKGIFRSWLSLEAILAVGSYCKMSSVLLRWDVLDIWPIDHLVVHMMAHFVGIDHLNMLEVQPQRLGTYLWPCVASNWQFSDAFVWCAFAWCVRLMRSVVDAFCWCVRLMRSFDTA